MKSKHTWKQKIEIINNNGRLNYQDTLSVESLWAQGWLEENQLSLVQISLNQKIKDSFRNYFFSRAFAGKIHGITEDSGL